MTSLRQLTNALILMALVVLAGTVGYVVIEGWPPLDAFYMTIISITTTGFAETRPLSPAGRIFTVMLIVMGVTGLAVVGGRAAQLFIEAHFLGRHRVSRKIRSLDNHYIVCGYGRLGRNICADLSDSGRAFVVVEVDPDKVSELREKGMLFVEGNATQDDNLQLAGIQRAKGLVAVLPTDAENVYVTLSAKVLNPKVFVVTRAIDEETEKKLQRAGADRVVKPYEIGANRMVNLLLRPGIVDFIDLVARKQGVDLKLEEVVVEAGSSLCDQTLASSGLRQNLNIIVVAIFRRDGELLYNPSADTGIAAGDRLIAIGQADRLQKLAQLCRPQPA